MIIDAHTHFTTAPLELQAYRGRQITDLGKPVKAKLQISEEELERLVRDNPPPPEWFAQPPQDLTRESWK